MQLHHFCKIWEKSREIYLFWGESDERIYEISYLSQEQEVRLFKINIPSFENCLPACKRDARRHVSPLKFLRSTWLSLSPYVFLTICFCGHNSWNDPHMFLASDEPSTDCDGGCVKARTATKQSNVLWRKSSFYWKGGPWAEPFISGTDTAEQQQRTVTYVAVCQDHIILIRNSNQGYYVLYNSQTTVTL